MKCRDARTPIAAPLAAPIVAQLVVPLARHLECRLSIPRAARFKAAAACCLFIANFSHQPTSIDAKMQFLLLHTPKPAHKQHKRLC